MYLFHNFMVAKNRLFFGNQQVLQFTKKYSTGETKLFNLDKIGTLV